MESHLRHHYPFSGGKSLDDIRLKVKSIYTVIPVEDHKIHLHRGDRVLCLDTDEISSRIIQSLDGKTSVKELLDRFRNQISRNDILALLLASRRDDLIFDTANKAEDRSFQCHPQLASQVMDSLHSFSNWAKSISTGKNKLENRLCVIGDGNAARELKKILETNTDAKIDRVDPDRILSKNCLLSSWAAAAIAIDSFKPTLLKKLNGILIENRIPFTHGIIEGETARLGPSVSVKMSPCIDCYVSRLEEHNPYLYIHEQFVESPAIDKTGYRFLAVKLAREIVKLSKGNGPPEYRGCVYSCDLSANTVSRDSLIAGYDCPVCGETAKESKRGPVRLTNLAGVHYFDNGYRTVGPDKSLSKTKHMIGRLGVVASTERIDDPDEVRLPVFAAYTTVTAGPYTKAPELRLHCGKGVSAEQAQASAVYESIERYCARSSRTEPVLAGAWNDVRDKTFPPESFAPPVHWNCSRCRNSCTPLDMETPIEWVQGSSFSKSEPVLIPANLVFLPYQPQLENDCRPYVISDSNGLAAGNTVEEAVFHAALEVIERDAVTIFHRTGRKASTVNLDKVANPLLDYAVSELEKNRMELMVAYIPYGIIHTACALLIDRTTDRPFYATGSGSHTDPAIAVVRAITEANHVRVGVRHALKTGTDTVDERRFDLASMRPFFNSGNNIKLSEIPNLSSNNILEDIELIAKRLKKIKSDILIYDLTRRTINIPVVRVILPWVQPADTYPCYRPTVRLMQSAKAREPETLYRNNWLW